MRAPGWDLPTAILGGAQKSGTTTLHRLLEAHPQVYVPPHNQEIHFFDLEQNFARGVDWYRAHFRGRGEQPVALQTSPLYLYERKVAPRIYELLPRVKLLFILRHPSDRAYSHYWHEVRFGWEDLGFEQALGAEAERIARGFEDRRRFSYVDRGHYALQLRRYFDLFPRDQILVLTQEAFKRRTAREARRIADFLDIDPDLWQGAESRRDWHYNAAMLPRWRPLQRLARPFRWGRWRYVSHAIDAVNLVSRPYPPMSLEMRQRLARYFEPGFAELEELAGIDCEPWRQRDAEILGQDPPGARERERERGRERESSE